MGEIIERLHHEIDAEIERLETSADPVDADEPVLEPYAARLHSLRDAVSALEGGIER